VRALGRKRREGFRPSAHQRGGFSLPEPTAVSAATLFTGGIAGFAAQTMRYQSEDVLVVVLSNYSFAPVGEIEACLAALVFSSGHASG
jgi:hypothetical protein